jgi:hypothetical protein
MIRAFSDYASVKAIQRRNIVFLRNGDKYETNIFFSKKEAIYSNWYPQIILDTNQNIVSENEECLIYFENAEKNEKYKKKLFSDSSFKFNSPLVIGNNKIALSCSCFIEDLKEIKATLIFSETSNSALPWVLLFKALIFFIIAVLGLLLCQCQKVFRLRQSAGKGIEEYQ